MKTAYLKTIVRSIRASFGRFMAILLIVALGVGFFSGLKVTMPSFMKTGDKFVRDHALYDYRLISTIGFNDEDIEKIREYDGLKTVEGAVFKDALATLGDSSTQNVVRFHTLTTDVNKLKVEEGRLPEAPDEIVVDGYSLGSGNMGKTLNVEADEGFKYDSYKIVGRVRSPYYLNFQKGTSDIGSGTVNFFVYVPKDGLDFEYYTEAFVKLSDDLTSWSDEYEKDIESRKDDLEKTALAAVSSRFDDVLGDAQKDYDDGLKEFNDALRDGSREISDAQKELDDAWEEIRDGEEKLAEAKEKLEDASKTLRDSDKKLNDAKNTLDSKRGEIDDAQRQFDSKKGEIEEAGRILDEKKKELDEAKVLVDQGLARLPELQAARGQLEASISALTKSREEALQMKDSMGDGAVVLEERITQLDSQIAAANDSLSQTQAAIKSIEDGKAAYEAGKKAYDEGLRQYEQGKAEYDSAYSQFTAGKSEFDSGLDSYNTGKRQYDNGLREYEDGLKEYEDSVKELEDGLKDYHDGLLEFYEGKSRMGNEIASASLLLDFYEGQIDSAERPDVIVLARDTNVGYVCFENDAHIVDGLAEVFPLFFFAIAALVCSTTMQRMVADERGQIGTMRALGYSKFAIIMKYSTYAGLASVTGCILGFAGGTKLFPFVIWEVYAMMYGFAPITFESDSGVFWLSLLVSVLCSVGTTVATCFGEFNEEPASLVRPKAPRAGKRILLERIDFIWKRLGFLIKVSARNVFRFKKRMWMMIIGIAGCTALVLTGFGLKDSIDNLLGFQYDEIMTYDILFSFDDDLSKKQIEKRLNSTAKKQGADIRKAYVSSKNLKHNNKETIRDVQLIASNAEDITDFINPHMNGEVFSFPADGGVGISSKLAETSGIKVGDDMTFEYGDEGKTVTFRVDFIFENYVYHYALINGNTYEEAFGEKFDPKSVLIKFNEKVEGQAYSYAGKVASKGDIKMSNVIEESRTSFENTMEKLNYVVILVIGCAALLAFIVLFNLNNINITERIREIATLKVLGFNRIETGSYVFRENFVLVFLGFAVGIPLGILLHSFVISQIKMDIVTYKVQILPQSYLFSLLTVLLFSVIVDLVMRGKIEKIDMAESLKSIE